MTRRFLFFCILCCSTLFAAQLSFSEYSVIVKYRQPLAKRHVSQNIFTVSNADDMKTLQLEGSNQYFAELSYSQPQNINSLVKELSQLEHVQHVQPNYLHPVSYIPSDANFDSQWQLTKIQADRAWDVFQGASSVVIGIIDTGVDYLHEDLQANIWSNPKEKLNNLDDDNNGRIDDIRGWDFVHHATDVAGGEDADTPDNDPMDMQGHGTFVAGCASAVTDNNIGVAGPAFNAKIMPLRAGFKGADGHGYVMTFAAMEAMQYAVQNGVSIINCSFGAAVDDKMMSDLALWALQSDVLICWAAGNDNSLHGVLPLSAPHVLTVASTDANDNKSSFSNYGEWVKISAPGSDVYSLGRNNNYYAASGTSFASPIVAGAAALLRAQHPDWSAGQVFMHLVDHADSIDYLDARYEGMLGKKGRLNLFNAVSFPFISEPHFQILRKTINDPDGDNDGFLDADEAVELVLRVENQWADARNVTMVLHSDDPAVHIQNAEIQFEHIRGLELTGFNSVENSNNPFQLLIDNTFPHNIHFSLFIQTDEGFTQIIDFHLAVNSQILFVDDDEGADAQIVYFDVMDSLSIPYDVWNRKVQGKTGTHLLRYPIIVWSAEAGLPTLDDDDRESIQAYLQQGGMLFIAGQDIGWDLCAVQNMETPQDYYNQYVTSGGSSKTFFQNYLHADFVKNIADFSFLRGVEENPVSAGIEFSIYNKMRSLEEQAPDALLPNDAAALFEYQDGNAGAVNYQGAYKLVNFGFGGLEAVAHEDDRYSIMRNVINYFTGIQLETEPLQDVLADTLNFSARVLSAKEKNVWLYLSRDHQEFERIKMKTSNDSDYFAILPQVEIAGHLAYAVFAVAADGLYAPSKLYSHTTGAVAPLLSAHVPQASLTTHPFISVKAESEIGIDPEQVFLHFVSDEPDSLLLYKHADDMYGAYISDKFKFGDIIHLYFSATDVYNKRSTTESLPLHVGLENFTTAANWSLDKAWDFDAEKHELTCWAGVKNVNSHCQYNYPLDFSDLQHATLEAEIRYNLADNRAAYLELSRDGDEWKMVGEYITGKVDDFYPAQWSLDNFTGSDCDSMRLRFRMKSSPADSLPVFAVRQIKILPLHTQVQTLNTKADEYALFKNYPNPFNACTTIAFALPNKSRVQLQIFDILGKQVRLLDDGWYESGEHRIIWDGCNSNGLPVSSGIYLYKLTAENYSAVYKLSLVR